MEFIKNNNNINNNKIYLFIGISLHNFWAVDIYMAKK